LFHENDRKDNYLVALSVDKILIVFNIPGKRGRKDLWKRCFPR
jgi:hypothetical protein